MKLYAAIGICLAVLLTCSTAEAVNSTRSDKGKHVLTPAGDSRISWCGRTLSEDGNITFDWSGVYCKIRFTGPYIALRCSDTKANYFNVWTDSEFSEKADKVIRTCGHDTTIVLADNLGRGTHEIMIQKRTEGEQGTVTFHSFITGGEILPAPSPCTRYIEFIGDSYTCGYGTENSIATDPFTPETENCNLAYAAIISRYFDADFSLVCHSGQGVARNYGGFGEGHTMVERYSQALDENPETSWGPEQADRVPDIVVIYLGANDFSTGLQPSLGLFKERYTELLGKVRDNYGEGVPVLCLAAKLDPGIYEYVRQACTECGMKNIYHATMQETAFNGYTDLGASWHPNYTGQKKMASIIIPYISTITGWEMPVKPYR